MKIPESGIPREGKALLTALEVANDLGFNSSTVRRWIAAGKIKAIQPGGLNGAYRIRRAELDRVWGIIKHVPPDELEETDGDDLDDLTG